MSKPRSYAWYEKHARETAALYESVSAERLGCRSSCFLEACTSLPGMEPDDHALESVFESVCLQRVKLRRDQQAPEWDG